MSDQKSVNRLSLFKHEITMQSCNLKKRFAKESLYSHQNNTNFLRELMNRMNYIYMNGTEPNEPWWIELFEMYYLGCYGDVCRYRRTRNLYVSLYFFFFLFSLSVSTLCRIAFRKAMRYIMNSNGSEQNKVIFTHPTECRRVWLRGLGDWLNSRPYSWIFNLLSGFQASLLFIFFHAVTNGTKPITYVGFTFEIGAAQPRFITDFAPPQRFFCVNRSRLWYDFHGGVEAVRSQSMNIASSKS